MNSIIYTATLRNIDLNLRRNENTFLKKGRDLFNLLLEWQREKKREQRLRERERDF